MSGQPPPSQPPPIKLPPNSQAGAKPAASGAMPVAMQQKIASHSSMKNVDTKSGSASSSSGSKETGFAQLPMAGKLSKVFIARLTQIASQYNSFYIFSFEITLYEILMVLVRLCHEGGEDKSKVGAKMKSKASSSDKASNKFCGLRSALDTIRNSEICGQLTHVIGVPQLWSQYKWDTKIGPKEVFVFANFINANYSGILKSVVFENAASAKRAESSEDESDGAAWLVNPGDFPLASVDAEKAKVDQAIIKILSDWMNFAALHQRMFAMNVDQDLSVPVEVEACQDESVDQEKVHKMNRDRQIAEMRRETEMLGKMFMYDYLHRWYTYRAEHFPSLGTGQKRQEASLRQTSDTTIGQKKRVIQAQNEEIERLRSTLNKNKSAN